MEIARTDLNALFPDVRVVMGLNSTSAARVLGKRAGSVRMATHQGLRRLAELLIRDEEHPGVDREHSFVIRMQFVVDTA